MKTFKDYVVDDTHGHSTFEQQYSCFTSYVGKERGRGDPSAIQYKLDVNECRTEFHNMLMLGNISSSHVSASGVLRTFVQYQAEQASKGVGGEVDSNKEVFTNTSVPSKRSAPDADSEATEGDLRSYKRSPRKVTILEVEFSAESGSDYVDSKPSSARSSLNSIDFLLIDHLVGPGTTSSRLTTNNRLVIDQVDVSQTLLDARRSLIKKQSELKDTSDLLTLNFIFDATFLKKHVPKDGQTSLLSVSIPTVPDEEKMLLFDCSEFVASHSFLDSKKHVRSRIQPEEESLAADLLRHYTERSHLWQQCTSYPAPSSSWLVQNEDTYTQAIVKGVIIGVVGDLELLDHWSRDPLPTPVGFEEVYNPDYFGEYDGFPIAIVEIKKPGATDDDIQGDQRRLPCMQKLMLDRMLSAGVMDPKVVGFLIRGSRCEITIMSLVHEALYVVKTIGVFELPQNNLQLGLLCPALGPLKLAHEMISRTLNAVKTRDREHDISRSWRRPSYYVKGNRIPPPSAD